MELTLKRQLEQAEFTKTRGGGYDRTEVDDFLDKSVAMAAKVEARLTQVLDENSRLSSGEGAGAAPGPSAEEIEAEVERRVAARMAELPTAPAAGPDEEEAAEQVRRTIVIAERTASEAVKEARADAARMVAEATERAAAVTSEAEERAAAVRSESEDRAASLTAEAEARAAQVRAEAEAEAASERQSARNRLALEISALEGSREALRSDVGVLERHVEEQRTQLRSTLGELQRLLDDPTGFRLAPTPALLDPELPDLSPEPEAGAAPAPEPEPEDQEGTEPAGRDDGAADDDEPFDPTALQVDRPGAPAPAEPSDADLEAEASVLDLRRAVVAAPTDGSFEAPTDDGATEDGPGEPEADPPPAGPEPLDFADVDHEAPGVHEPVDSGPPTAPVSVVDLEASAEDAPEDDDAFLAELRKAMADDEPLGPRDEPSPSTLGPMFDDEDRRGWRFGKRR